MIPIITQVQQLQKSQGIKLTGAALLIAPWLLLLASKKSLSKNDRISLAVIAGGMIYFNASSYLKMKELTLKLADELPSKIESGQIIDDVLENKISVVPGTSSNDSSSTSQGILPGAYQNGTSSASQGILPGEPSPISEVTNTQTQKPPVTAFNYDQYNDFMTTGGTYIDS